ncbi:VOC family protein, partial [Patescibacteria group bacterium]|nr:VOC family protein [Patescibacteria group bacterium]
KDLKQAKKWYDEVLGFLGFDIAFADDRNVYYKSEKFPFYLAIFQGHKKYRKDKMDRYRVGFHHLGLAVGSKKIVDDFYKFLSKREDVDIETKPRHYPDYGDKLYYALFFHDPDGLRL